MRLFDYSFLEHGMIPARLINIVEAISSLKAREAELKGLNGEVFARLESIAKVQSVKSSNAIEGIVTTDQRINEIVTQNSAPLNHNEAEIAGYRDALNYIHMGFGQLGAREADIMRLHDIMLSHTISGGGEYKKTDNAIIEVDPYGRQSVRFEPVPASETPEAMAGLALAYMGAQSNNNINKLLLIPCFVLDFLSIHPFDDGNGRLSRLISILLLYKSGYDAVRYISFEEQINRMKEGYYEALRLSSINWHEGSNDYFPFIINFLTCLLRCYKELDKRYAVVSTKKTTKKGRVEAIVLSSLLPVSKAEIEAILLDVSATTVEAVLADMLKRGLINKIGSGRKTKYLKAGV